MGFAFGGGLDGGLDFYCAVEVYGFGHCVFQLVDAFARDCRDFEEWELFALGEGLQLLELVGVGYVGLAGDEDGGLGGQGGVEGL